MGFGRVDWLGVVEAREAGGRMVLGIGENEMGVVVAVWMLLLSVWILP
jgi:hypothetical protein